MRRGCKYSLLMIILFIFGIIANPCTGALTLEKNALVDGLVLIFPELKDKEDAYIDLDRSGDSRSEPGVPEIIWDRPGDGQGIIQAQEMLELIVYKDNYRYLTVEKLENLKKLLDKVGSIQGGSESQIMTTKVARSYANEIAGLLSMRRKLPDLVTKNERERISKELVEVMGRITKQYAEEADKEASGTFKQDIGKYNTNMEVVRKAEEDDPMELPFAAFDDEKHTARNSMVRIVGDELKNYKQRYIKNDMAIFSIGKMGGRNALNILVLILQDPEYSDNKKDTIKALGMIGEECTPAAVEKIGQYLDSSQDVEVKRAAIKTLGKVGTKEAIGLLKKYAENPPEDMPGLRNDALRALVDIAENERKKGIASRELIPLFRKYVKSGKDFQSALAIRGLALVNNLIPYGEIWALMRKMGDVPNPEVLDEIVTTIQLVSIYNKESYKQFFMRARTGESKRIILYLVDCLSGGKKEYLRKYPKVRIKIAEILKEIIVSIPWLEGLDYIIPEIVDEDPIVSDKIASIFIDASRDYPEAIHARNYKYSVPVMTYRMVLKRKETPKMLDRGLEIIGKQVVNNTTVIEYIFTHLEDLNESIVRQTIRALASLISEITKSDRYHLPKRLELVRALVVKSTLPIDIRISAIEVAGKIGFSDAKSSGNNIVKALYEVLSDRNAPVDLRIAAIRTFPRINEKQGRIHDHWIAMKDKIVEYISRGNVEIRKAAVLSTGELAFDSAETRKALYNALSDEQNKPIYYEILEAIGRLNNKESSEYIRNFIITAKDVDIRIKKIAIRVLGNCGDPDMIDVLADALADSETAEEAARGLEQIEREKIEKRLKQRISQETNPEVKKRLQDILQR